MLNPIALRLRPGLDLKKELNTFATRNGIDAACILTCVGSLIKAVLRYDNQEQTPKNEVNRS